MIDEKKSFILMFYNIIGRRIQQVTKRYGYYSVMYYLLSCGLKHISNLNYYKNTRKVCMFLESDVHTDYKINILNLSEVKILQKYP